MSRPQLPLGVIFWSGPSELDGRPIVALAPFTPSSNPKTGPMLQTYILDQELSPIDAVKAGTDVSVCGNCKLRGLIRGSKVEDRVCYVDLGKAPLSIWRAWKAGRYVPLEDWHRPQLSWRPIRRGSYGDPAAVPVIAWARLEHLSSNENWGTGYTHQWRTHEDQKSRCMASVDTPEERVAAKNGGWRTFRVLGPDDPVLPGEVVCPASEEAGYKATCYQCQLCNGVEDHESRPDVVIVAHGQRKGALARVQ